MRTHIARALEKQGIQLYGYCTFASLRTRLLSCRAATRLPNDPQTVIVCLFPYRVDSDAPRNLSRYACVPDYHQVAGAALERAATSLNDVNGFTFTPFVDNSPIPEVYAAALAGLGCIGNNGLLIHPQFGSYVFIGTIVTDAPVDVKEFALQKCIGCDTCLKACPTGALTQKGPDAGRCLSAISQRRGELTAQETTALRENGLLWGCDRCQEVCPLNRTAQCAPFPGFDTYVPWLEDIPEGNELKKQPYGWRGAAVLHSNQRILNSK